MLTIDMPLRGGIDMCRATESQMHQRHSFSLLISVLIVACIQRIIDSGPIAVASFVFFMYIFHGISVQHQHQYTL